MIYVISKNSTLFFNRSFLNISKNIFIMQKSRASFSPKKNDIRDIVSQFLATHKQNPISSNYKHHNFVSHSLLKSKDKNKGMFIHKVMQMQQLGSGRDIFSQNRIRKSGVPGPGQYQANLLTRNNWGYIAREPQQIASKHLQNKKKMMSTVGPGFYKHQSKEVQLSNHRKPTGLSFAPKKVPRFAYKQKNSNPGPGEYDPIYSMQKSSSHTNIQCYSISKTHRTSIINKQKIPGPGQYDCEKYYKKQKDPNYKPTIEFKFVYGHPS